MAGRAPRYDARGRVRARVAATAALPGRERGNQTAVPRLHGANFIRKSGVRAVLSQHDRGQHRHVGADAAQFRQDLRPRTGERLAGVSSDTVGTPFPVPPSHPIFPTRRSITSVNMMPSARAEKLSAMR